MFTPVDYLTQVAQLKNDRDFDPSFSQIVDCREIALMDLTADQIQELTKHSAFQAGSQHAFVASGPIQFGLSRMFASYREAFDGQRVSVFREMNDALTWLNLPPESLLVRNE